MKKLIKGTLTFIGIVITMMLSGPSFQSVIDEYYDKH